MPDHPVTVSARSFFNRFAVLFKLAVIGVLLLLFLIPLTMEHSQLSERLGLRNKAVNDIAAGWGQSQRITGPVLKVPFRARVTVTRQEKIDGKNREVKEESLTVRHAYFLPRTLTVSGSIAPQILKRGIYEAVLWRADCEFSGDFDLSAWPELKIDAKDMLWNEAVLCVTVSDLRGARKTITLKFGGADSEFLPGSDLGSAGGIHAPVKFSNAGTGVWPAGVRVPFEFKLALNGSGELAFAPVGRETKVRLASPWPDPKFSGQFLPTTREVTPGGFTAAWELSHYGRNYPQQWSGGESLQRIYDPTLNVSLLAPVDSYRSVERAVKYAVLFITLLFTAYFLFEVVARLRIHPFQYILVGAAICVFYLGILSLSELLAFGWAYLLSAAATWLMLTLYTLSVLKTGRRTLTVAALLAFILAFLYTVLQLQDYALLFGTLLLFAALAAVMFTTRKVDWYDSNATREPPPLPRDR
ncbi:MAG: cell envelope integrity protein CreD [Verrucomicrobiales bacterium]|jgi:inner membrane protein|nr:cell envelope integrity protein CreD [Verrucomicrobiales bacterium]